MESPSVAAESNETKECRLGTETEAEAAAEIHESQRPQRNAHTVVGTLLLRRLFLRNLERGLREFGLPVKPFLDALAADHAQLSGGFALQVVQGKFCQKSDMDIYFGDAQPVWTGQGTAMVSLLQQHGYVMGEPTNEYTVALEQPMGLHPLTQYGRILVQPYVVAPGKMVQLIAAQTECIIGPDRVPSYLQHYDLTVCCVAFSMGKDGQLHWLMPHVRDIIDGVLDATPFLLDVDFSFGINKKREQTIARVLKYVLRGFAPTATLLKKCGMDVEDDITANLAALRLGE